VMLSDPKDIKSDPVSQLNLFEQMAKPDDRINLGSCHWIGRRGDETIDPDLH